MSSLADFENKEDFMYLCLALLCIFCAALAAGLTIGLVSMDRNALRLLMINGTEEEKMQVRKVMPLVRDRHWLLVTLFLFNATANEALPVFLEKIVPGYAAIVASALLVLFFGEIIPSSIFGGRRQLELAAKLSWVVRILFVMLFIIAKPIAMFLDYWVGKHEDNIVPFNAKDLYTLLGLSADAGHTEEAGPTYRAHGGRGDLPREYGVLSSSSSHARDQAVVLEFQAQPSSPGGVISVLHGGDDGHVITINATLENKTAAVGPGKSAVRRRPMLYCTGDDAVDGEDSSGSEPSSSPASDDSPSHRAPSFLHSVNGERVLLDKNSVSIAQGAIVCSRKTVTAIMLRPEKYFAVNADDVVSLELLEAIGDSGFSRIVVRGGSFEVGHNVLGYLVVKELMSRLRMLLPSIAFANSASNDAPPLLVKHLPLHPVEFFGTSVTVLDALSYLKCGESRIAAVSDDGSKNKAVLGFFSMEDIMEEIIQEEIEDEKDYAKFYVAKRDTKNVIGNNCNVIGTTIGLF